MGYLLGYDIGSSAVKAALVEAATGNVVASAVSPRTELRIVARRPGWAEQEPEWWWRQLRMATRAVGAKAGRALRQVEAIGIAAQMHGLVVVDSRRRVLRPAILWCDSRAVAVGERAFEALGGERCLAHLLNSPGNFTASKLRWVRDHEPAVFARIDKLLLPGDYIGMRLTDRITTTVSGLSEATLWDFRSHAPAEFLLAHYGIDPAVLPELVPTFGPQGGLSRRAAGALGLAPGIPVAYRAGDQPNNAFALRVLEPGAVAATAGTSGVVYGVSRDPVSDPASRINTFAHVNHAPGRPRYGALVCLNAAGSLNGWLRRALAGSRRGPDYDAMNRIAERAPVGAAGLVVLPYGNGVERTLGNRTTGAAILRLDCNRHDLAHLLRATQEGIAFGLQYGLEILREKGIAARTIRVGRANMFRSPLFRRTFANVSGARIAMYDTDGSEGAARGAGIGAGIYRGVAEAFRGLRAAERIAPESSEVAACREAYLRWREALDRLLAARGSDAP
jgi:xylulokinase